MSGTALGLLGVPMVGLIIWVIQWAITKHGDKAKEEISASTAVVTAANDMLEGLLKSTGYYREEDERKQGTINKLMAEVITLRHDLEEEKAITTALHKVNEALEEERTNAWKKQPKIQR